MKMQFGSKSARDIVLINLFNHIERITHHHIYLRLKKLRKQTFQHIRTTGGRDYKW